MRQESNLVDIELFLEQKFSELENSHFALWSGSKESPIKVELVGGGVIEHQGPFNDNAKRLFWDSNYIPEYVEKYCFEILDQIEEISERPESKIKKNKELRLCKKAFRKFVNRVFSRMREVEEHLLSDSLNPIYTKKVSRLIVETRRDVNSAIASYKTGMFGGLLGNIGHETDGLSQIFRYKSLIVKGGVILLLLYVASTYLPRLF